MFFCISQFLCKDNAKWLQKEKILVFLFQTTDNLYAIHQSIPQGKW